MTEQEVDRILQDYAYATYTHNILYSAALDAMFREAGGGNG